MHRIICKIDRVTIGNKIITGKITIGRTKTTWVGRYSGMGSKIEQTMVHRVRVTITLIDNLRATMDRIQVITGVLGEITHPIGQIMEPVPANTARVTGIGQIKMRETRSVAHTPRTAGK